MEQAFKDELIIDTDIHPALNSKRVAEFLPEPYKTRYRSNQGSGHIGVWNPNGVRRADAKNDEGWIDESPDTLTRWFLDEYHIDYGILNPGNFNTLLTPEPDFAAAAAHAKNRHLAEDWLQGHPRLRGSILVSPNDPLLAAREIEYWAGHPGFVQVLMPSAAIMPYGHRYYHPIFEAASRNGFPVAIHPGAEGTAGTNGFAIGLPSSYFVWHTGLLTPYIAHLISLVAEGTFQKFPDLKFVMVEGGVAWLPPLLWRFDKNWKALRQTTPWLTMPPSQVVYEHMFLTTQPVEESPNPDHFRQIMQMFPAEKMVMFSSDYSHWDGDTPDFAARAFPKEMRRAVLFETAQKLYKLPPVPVVPEKAAVHAG